MKGRHRRHYKKVGAPAQYAGALLVSAAWVFVLISNGTVSFGRNSISPEASFTDASPSGMHIVPASCASSVEHWPGECSMSCLLTINGSTNASITAGSVSTVKISWMAPKPDDSFDGEVGKIPGSITDIGVVSWSGTLDIAAPSFTTTYTYSGSYVNAFGTTLGTFTCPSATLTVTGGTDPLYINKLEPYQVEGSTVSPGDFITYRLEIENKSTTQTQTNLRVDDAIPANTTLAWQGGGTDSTCTPLPGHVCWLQSSAPPGWSGYVDFKVQVSATVGDGVSINNTATIQSDENSTPVASNDVSNTTAVCTTPIPMAIDNSLGYFLGSYAADQRISNSYTSPICVGSNDNQSYFIPANSQAEIDAFKAAVSAMPTRRLYYTPIP